MRTVLLGILFLFKGADCASESSFDGLIRHVAVGNGTVFVATDSQLHQLRHDLVVEKSKSISDQNSVQILLPFEANGTLITCGTSDSGYCEVLNISDINHTIYWENNQIFIPLVNETSVAFLLDYSTSSSKGTYMLVGREEKVSAQTDAGVTLRNTLQSQFGEIFSKSNQAADASIEISNVAWVDGFQVNLASQLTSYLFANVNENVVFLKMNNKEKKSEMTKYVKVGTLKCCQDKPRKKVVSSTFMVCESSLLWMGIFTAEHPDDPDNTVLAIYNLTNIKAGNPPVGFICKPDCDGQV